MKIPRDKALHFLAGFVLASVAIYFWSQVVSLPVASFIGYCIAAGIGALKEAGDKWGGYGGDCDGLDLLATCLGANLVQLIVTLVILGGK